MSGVSVSDSAGHRVLHPCPDSHIHFTYRFRVPLLSRAHHAVQVSHVYIYLRDVRVDSDGLAQVRCLFLPAWAARATRSRTKQGKSLHKTLHNHRYLSVCVETDLPRVSCPDLLLID